MTDAPERTAMPLTTRLRRGTYAFILLCLILAATTAGAAAVVWLLWQPWTVQVPIALVLACVLIYVLGDPRVIP